MENARTTSSAAARAAPPSATCPMVTRGRPARGRGGAQGGGGIARVPGRGTLPDPGTIGKVLGGWNQIGPSSPSLGSGDTKAWPWGHKGVAEPRRGREGEVREAPTPSCI